VAIKVLTDKQAKFVEEYCLDQNATQALVRAGYSEKGARQSASTLLAKPDIRDAIDARLAQHRERCDVTIDSLTGEYEEHRLGAVDTSQFAAANGATAGKARLHGLDRPADAVHNTQINLAFGDLELARRMAYLIENGADAVDP